MNKSIAVLGLGKYGMSLVRELNNVELVSSLMMSAHMDGVPPFDTIDMLADLTAEDVLGFMADGLKKENAVLSVIERMDE